MTETGDCGLRQAWVPRWPVLKDKQQNPGGMTCTHSLAGLGKEIWWSCRPERRSLWLSAGGIPESLSESFHVVSYLDCAQEVAKNSHICFSVSRHWKQHPSRHGGSWAWLRETREELSPEVAIQLLLCLTEDVKSPASLGLGFPHLGSEVFVLESAKVLWSSFQDPML